MDYNPGNELVWVVTVSNSDKVVVCTNKYGEVSGVVGTFIVEVNPLEELSKMPVDTLVKVTKKSTGEEFFRYLYFACPTRNLVYLFDNGATSLTTSNADVYREECYTFEVMP
jgi:hypothetical protein